MSRLPDIQVLFCDPALLVVNKPAGLGTLPDGYNPSLPHIKSLLEAQYGRLWIVHRLDKETSGVLLLTRSAQAHRSLNMQFEKHLVSKVYHALVRGNIAWIEKTVDLPLRPNGDRRHRTVVDTLVGKPAVTHFKVLEHLGPFCFLEAIPETGRTHQIRAHLAVVGLYIVGDKLYAPPRLHPPGVASAASEQETNPAFNTSSGMALHAYSLEVSHPLSGEGLKFVAPYPSEFERLLQQLRRAVL